MIHFEVSKQTNPWLDEKTYALALDSFTKVCCVLFTCNGKYLITKRQTLPHNDFWINKGITKKLKVINI